MKKFLSLVLALVMTMSLVTVSAGAKDFTDDSKITYKEAVDVISAIGVVDGDTTGAFNPQGSLTRGAAAKIICNLILGPTTASALSADAAPYSDVPTSHVFAGYIAYCSQQGIISGYADGSFRPAAPLTGYAFMKMLLGALGYDAKVEGYVGPNWSVQVAKRALNIGLHKGLEGDFVGTKALNREEACLYAFNTLLATMVEYPNNLSITVGDASISSASKAEEVTANTSVIAQHFGSAPDNNGNHTVQFAEKYFKNLTARAEQAEGRIGRVMQWKGKDCADFHATDTLLASSANGTAYAKLTTKSDSKYIGFEPDLAGVTYYYQDGAASTTWPASTTVTVNEATIQGYAATKGVIVNFLDTDSDGKYEAVSVVKKTVAQLGSDARTVTSGAVTQVTLPGTGITAVDSDDIVYPEGLKKDDVILHYASQNGTRYVYAPESVVGTLTASTENGANSSATVDSVVYNLTGLSGNNITNAATLATAAKSKADTTFYLDDGGQIAFYVLKDSAIDLNTTLFIRDAATVSGYTYQAKALFMDGTTEIITVNKTAAYNGTLKDVYGEGTSGMADGYLKENYFYEFAKTASGTYNLTAYQYQLDTGATTANNSSDVVVTRGNADITLSDASHVYANANSVYLLEKGKVDTTPQFVPGTSYAVYTGVGNTAGYTDSGHATSAAQSSANSFVLYDAYNNVMAVVARNGKLDTTSAVDYDVVLPVSGPTTVYKADRSVDYYWFKAVVNGELVEEYKTDASTTLTVGVPVLIDGYNDGKASSICTHTTPVEMAPTAPAYGVEVTMNGRTMQVKNSASAVQTAFALADDAKLVVYNVADKTVSIDEPYALYAATGHYYSVQTVAASTTNSAVKYIFVNDYSSAPATLSKSAVSVTVTGSVTDSFTVLVPTGFTATVTSNDTAKATVSGTVTPGSASTITVTPVAAGSTTLTVAVTNTASGVVTNYTVSVTVNA